MLHIAMRDGLKSGLPPMRSKFRQPQGVPPIYSSERHGLNQDSILANVRRLNSGHAMQPLANNNRVIQTLATNRRLRWRSVVSGHVSLYRVADAFFAAICESSGDEIPSCANESRSLALRCTKHRARLCLPWMQVPGIVCPTRRWGARATSLHDGELLAKYQVLER